MKYVQKMRMIKMDYNLQQICQYTYELKLKDISFKDFINKIDSYIISKSKLLTKVKINEINIKIFKGNKIIINSKDIQNIDTELKKI